MHTITPLVTQVGHTQPETAHPFESAAMLLCCIVSDGVDEEVASLTRWMPEGIHCLAAGSDGPAPGHAYP